MHKQTKREERGSEREREKREKEKEREIKNNRR
jgi:hypothetical protein